MYERNSDLITSTVEVIDSICEDDESLRLGFYCVMSNFIETMPIHICDIIWKPIISSHCINNKRMIKRVEREHQLSDDVLFPRTDWLPWLKSLLFNILQIYPTKTEIIDILMDSSCLSRMIHILVSMKNMYLLHIYIDKYIELYVLLSMVKIHQTKKMLLNNHRSLIDMNDISYVLNILIKQINLSTISENDMGEYFVDLIILSSDKEFIRKILSHTKTITVFSTVLEEYIGNTDTINNELVFYLIDELVIMMKNNLTEHYTYDINCLLRIIFSHELEDKYPEFIQHLLHNAYSLINWAKEIGPIVIHCSMNLFKQLYEVGPIFLYRESVVISLIEENMIDKLNIILSSWVDIPDTIISRIFFQHLLYSIVYGQKHIRDVIGVKFLLQHFSYPEVINAAFNVLDPVTVIDALLNRVTTSGNEELLNFIIKLYPIDRIDKYNEILSLSKRRMSYELISYHRQIIRSPRSAQIQ